MNNAPPWPAKLTREQQKWAKQREKDFAAALKDQSRGTGWRLARGILYRQSQDWFISVLPSLLWESGALARMTVKPMTLDPLFWDIAGLSENDALPLSFRATGAWVLRPPSNDSVVGPDTKDVQQLAREVLDWSNHWAAETLKAISTTAMLDELLGGEQLRGRNRALAICLSIMTDDLERALQLCQVDDPAGQHSGRESGGFVTGKTPFSDQARDWIARRRT